MHGVLFVVSMFVIAGVFAVLFKYLPDVNVQWHDVFIGALFTSLLFTIGKFAIGMYLGKASFGSTYGAAGSLVIVLVWSITRRKSSSSERSLRRSTPSNMARIRRRGAIRQTRPLKFRLPPVRETPSYRMASPRGSGRLA